MDGLTGAARLSELKLKMRWTSIPTPGCLDRHAPRSDLEAAKLFSQPIKKSDYSLFSWVHPLRMRFFFFFFPFAYFCQCKSRLRLPEQIPCHSWGFATFVLKLISPKVAAAAVQKAMVMLLICPLEKEATRGTRLASPDCPMHDATSFLLLCSRNYQHLGDEYCTSTGVWIDAQGNSAKAYPQPTQS